MLLRQRWPLLQRCSHPSVACSAVSVVSSPPSPSVGTAGLLLHRSDVLRLGGTHPGRAGRVLGPVLQRSGLLVPAGVHRRALAVVQDGTITFIRSDQVGQVRYDSRFVPDAAL